MAAWMGSPFVCVRTAMPHFVAGIIQMNIQQRQWNMWEWEWDWKCAHLRHMSAADCRCWSTDEPRTQQGPPMWHSSAILLVSLISQCLYGNSFQTNIVESRASCVFPSCFTEAQNSSGSHWDVRCEFWEDVGSRQTQGALLTREDQLTCQSCHSSVNSCLIRCWKLLLPGPRGQRWRVSPPPSPRLRELWLRGKNLSLLSSWREELRRYTKCTLTTFAEGIKTSFRPL